MKVILRGAGIVIASIIWLWTLSWALGLVSEPSTVSVAAGIGLLFLLAVALGYAGRGLYTSLVIALAVLTTGCGGTTIQPGHAGIVVNSYGTNRGVQD